MSPSASFAHRHIGISPTEQQQMLHALGLQEMDSLIDQVVPATLRIPPLTGLPKARSEFEALRDMRAMLSRNRVLRSLLGLGYHDCITPPVIQRNLLENPAWYTAYTPYQAEIAQGRLEALLNFQTLIAELTALPVANASLLDEGTACAEAMTLAARHLPDRQRVLVSNRCHAHVREVLRTRLLPLGLTIDWCEPDALQPAADVAAVLVSYPDTLGRVDDWQLLADACAKTGSLLVVSADLLSLTLLKPPGEWGAAICVGNSQRFGVPLGFGGPHAAFMAVRDDLKRKLPGRLVGVSQDEEGRMAYRLALQTREQHIRREKATSNICTAQVLLAVMASMFAVYHGPEGLRAIAQRIHRAANWLATQLQLAGFELCHDVFFDTLAVRVAHAAQVVQAAQEAGFNLRVEGGDCVVVALDEKITGAELLSLLSVFQADASGLSQPDLNSALPEALPQHMRRTTPFLQQPVFHLHRTETAMMRYLRQLQDKDIALDRSMIPLGSCTMKLNAAAEMMPLSWSEVNGLHPYVPADQSQGYTALFADLESWLATCTGFAAVSLQPNAGSQGEFAGLLAIKRYHEANGQTQRRICLIPTSAHGTNPASAIMCGYQVLGVACDSEGNIDLSHLRQQLQQHGNEVAALMITYPSTHGVFEEDVQEICALVHACGAQVYMDGANLNAQLGLTSPAAIGADVCHLNLHKTFCIPHGGGGPGVGPIAVAAHLAPFLPGHPQREDSGAVCSAPWGSASILTISWMYLAMMGEQLTACTEHAILAANYVATRLSPCFPVLYRGKQGRVAHECILDLRHFQHIKVEDVAKRLMDYGFHAPTMSWPVAGTLMIEPTESENLAELDRFIEAMQTIHAEIMEVELGTVDAAQSLLRRAPHTAQSLLQEPWQRPYSRERAAFPLPWVAAHKYWPPVARIDNVAGDRHLICSCISMEDLAGESAGKTPTPRSLSTAGVGAGT